MSRPPSVKVTRPLPTYRALIKLYNAEDDPDKVRRLHVIILMKKMKKAEAVAKMCGVSANTVRRWVGAFNEVGLEEKKKKNAPGVPPP